MIRRCNPRHVLSGFKGLIPTTEPNRIRGLRGKKKQWLCTVAGFDLYRVDGAVVRAQWADFIGGSHHLVNRFVPTKELWIDGTVKEWPGYIASHELLEALLMSLLGWKYERAHEAANELEQEIRARFEDGSSETTLAEIWSYHLAERFPNGQDTGSVAAHVSRQLWKFL